MAGTSSQPKVLIVDDTRTNINILVETLRDRYKLGSSAWNWSPNRSPGPWSGSS